MKQALQRGKEDGLLKKKKGARRVEDVVWGRLPRVGDGFEVTKFREIQRLVGGGAGAGGLSPRLRPL